MHLYSTNNKSKRVDLKEAVLSGLPDDKGLFMPSSIPVLGATFFREIRNLSFPALVLELSDRLIGDVIPRPELKKLMEAAIDFDAPLVPLDDRLGVLELFHGPSLAFKDFGARFMAQIMGYFIKEERRTLRILVATSGDTGGAVAAGFLNTPGIEVIILYPKGKVSDLQEKQLTTLGNNIRALEVEGNFDDCQAMVKRAFLDPELRKNCWLSSANSINIARLIPQSFYYFRAYQQLPDPAQPFAFIVPSGNFGNLTAGLIAKKMGLPVSLFVAATNRNKVVPDYLQMGRYQPMPSVPTISNAMDVGNPSNFVRMMELYDKDWARIKEDVAGWSFDDEDTMAAIRKVYQLYDYTIDPHGAVGYLAYEKLIEKHPEIYSILLETAHPAKFLEIVEQQTGVPIEIPERLEVLRDKPKEAVLIPNDFKALKTYLLSK